MQRKKPRVDSHQHFWLRERGGYDWLSNDFAAINRDFLPSDLTSILSQAGVTETVLIQATETDQETDFLLALAEETDFILGVVGWVDMEKKQVVSRLRTLARNKYFKGIRPMIQDIIDNNWMLNPELDGAYEALSELELCFDALVKPQHLPNLHTLLKKHPQLNVVIDHGAKPDIAKNAFDKWSNDISRIADDTNAHCKLSGLITEAEPNASFDQLRPYVEHLLSCFGPQRIMWVSDWPVINLASNYLSWVEACEAYLSHLSDDEQTAIWSETAKRFYRL